MTLADKLDPKHTALIVVDMQNDFCAPTGLMASNGKDVSRMDDLVHGIHSLVNICVAQSIPVLYTQQIYDRAKLTDLQNEQYDLDGKMITCDIKGDGWKFYGFSPDNNEVYKKYSYNIFSNNQLKNNLEEWKIKTLIITGVSTQICVETAIRNGFDIGYKIIVPSELVATTSNDPATQERTLNLVRKTYGVVSSLNELSELLAQ